MGIFIGLYYMEILFVMCILVEKKLKIVVLLFVGVIIV